MENMIVTLVLLVCSACANFFESGLQQRFQPRQQAPSAPTSTPEQPQPPQARKPPADAVFYREVSWSPDGARLAFSSMQNGKWNIYLMRADGSELKQLTSDPEVMNFGRSWSPDGKQIVFSAKRGEQAKADIYVMNADGSDVKQLTTDPAHDSAPAWSPDGKRIAFISDRGGKDHEVHIFVMMADGSGQTRLTSSETHDYDPQWSPDSRQLVYYAEKGDRKDQIWLMNADGSEPKLLTGNVGHNIFPSFAPDGKSIIFTTRPDGAAPGNDYRIATIQLAGSSLKHLSEQQAFLARFSPNGSRIAFLTGDFPRNAIFAMNADGSGLKKVTP
jgi:Tol biopolymer transport system component